MRETVAANGGDEVKTIGDNIMVAFTQNVADAPRVVVVVDPFEEAEGRRLWSTA